MSSGTTTHTLLRGRRAVSLALYLSDGISSCSNPVFPERVTLKRIPAQPRPAHTVSTQGNAPQTMAPVPYETTI